MKILFVSLGCDKNLVDSEVMLGFLGRAGYQFTDDESEADIIVVNTCCFIGDAKEESISTLLEMAKQKETGRCKVLIAAGCLAQRYKREVLEEIPEVDGILGTASCDKITEVVEETLEGKKCEEFESLDRQRTEEEGRVVTTGGHYAYLKIAEGCDKHCTYCVIPSVRGRYRSVPLDELVKEVEQLSEGGVRELILVAQETTLYGVDLYGKKMLPVLLKKLAFISGIHWIRLLYCYPEEITDELIEVVKTEEKICHYMDIPIQHASDRILKRMGRKTDRQEITKRICRLREEIPDIAIRTTMITGFPGETEEDMEELLDFVDEMEFDRLGVFPYSQEEDTPAAVMDGQVPEEVKNERRNQVMELQQEIAFAHGEEMVGEVLEVFIEGKVADESAYVGRTYMDAPGVDGYIFVNTELELMSGMFVRVKVTGAVDYDLIGELIDEDEFTE
ncbi:30S ribosomal protein S12 methylthiotransferase RimO [Qiania dongpingensis]|uniref:Ribosomal protein uS12 methylthiotransferase RimO n=1 Tax=Qiania dongpingensis TaxID=2763669 RepID=A0A7G9G511_9FIRM|nr:30S ribosomal protein S12 methylthiotransferase RimO [Qiania dongpingensis]QNM05893.1 30S ribosomal protein S12 methylthiotransferase RimO [Qiania dongpingensis]